jgi:hypothetical protein
MVAQNNGVMQLLVVAQEETSLTGSRFCSPSGGVSGRNVIERFLIMRTDRLSRWVS